MTRSVHCFEEAYAGLEHALHRWEAGRSGLEVLEAGGGSLSHLRFASEHRVTVVDLSAEQLERNGAAQVKIQGDLHTLDLGEQRFDVVVSWDVIEHLANPALVLDKLARAVRPGGLLVLAAPNTESLQGMITRWTPHWFHVFVMKYVFGNATAGLPGHPPFPTVHHRDIAPRRLKDWAARSGLEVRYWVPYEGTRRRALHRKSSVLGRLYDGVVAAGSRVSRRSLEESDFFLVLGKRAAADDALPPRAFRAVGAASSPPESGARLQPVPLAAAGGGDDGPGESSRG